MGGHFNLKHACYEFMQMNGEKGFNLMNVVGFGLEMPERMR